MVRPGRAALAILALSVSAFALGDADGRLCFGPPRVPGSRLESATYALRADTTEWIQEAQLRFQREATGFIRPAGPSDPFVAEHYFVDTVLDSTPAVPDSALSAYFENGLILKHGQFGNEKGSIPLNLRLHHDPAYDGGIMDPRQ